MSLLLFIHDVAIGGWLLLFGNDLRLADDDNENKSFSRGLGKRIFSYKGNLLKYLMCVSRYFGV